jgi:hypothetical protein
MRQVFACVAGLALAVGVILLVHALNAQIYPLPIGLDTADEGAMGSYVRTLPLASFLLVLTGYWVGALVGSATAARLTPVRPDRVSSIVGAVLLAFCLMDLSGRPHPGWFGAANVLVVAVGAWVGYRVGGRRREQA